MARLESDIIDAIDQVLNNLASKVVLIAKRYEHTLGEIEEKTNQSKAKVKSALERMDTYGNLSKEDWREVKLGSVLPELL